MPAGSIVLLGRFDRRKPFHLVGHVRCPTNPAEPEGDVKEVAIATQCPKPETNKVGPRAFHDLRHQRSPDSTTPPPWMHIKLANSASTGRRGGRIAIGPRASQPEP